jgi:hypothetical protein
MVISDWSAALGRGWFVARALAVPALTALAAEDGTARLLLAVLAAVSISSLHGAAARGITALAKL